MSNLSRHNDNLHCRKNEDKAGQSYPHLFIIIRAKILEYEIVEVDGSFSCGLGKSPAVDIDTESYVPVRVEVVVRSKIVVYAPSGCLPTAIIRGVHKNSLSFLGV